MQAPLIANCVFNAFFSFTAITLNIVTIKKHSNSNFWDYFGHLVSNREFPYLCLVLWCCSFSRRQILGCSSSSQIPGTCDSQAHCCCSDLDLDHKCDSDVAVHMDSAVKCFCDYFSTCSKRLLPHYSLVLFQDLLSCTSPHQSNSRTASAASTE